MDFNAKNEEGNNALHLLFINFSSNPNLAKVIAKSLIKKGTKINAKNKSDYTPIQLAVINNQIEAITYALEHNMYARQFHFHNEDDEYLNQSTHFDFNTPGGSKGQTVLHLAVLSNNGKII